MAAVGPAEIVTVFCPPGERLNWEGVAVMPAGNPLIVMLACAANPFVPVTPTVTVLEDPAATEILAGCTVRVKS
jgi:hypothetical protein